MAPEHARMSLGDGYTPHTTKAWLTARTTCYKLPQQGHNVSPELLRKWAEREKIESRTLRIGNVYTLNQVLVVLSS